MGSNQGGSLVLFFNFLRIFFKVANVILKRAWLVRALDASEPILKNMLYTTEIIRLPKDSLKGFGPSGFDPVKNLSKLKVPLAIR